uniref:protein-synthesizing GTPase n=1 Tax=viral metagenome TaxID=1070528 RepID=A0A6C0CKD4_9ZZZZ
MKTIKYSEIIKNQPTVNIGTIGSVSHGKSTLVYDITATKTQKHKKEKERNITINLGYANAKIYRCPDTGLLMSTPSSTAKCFHPDTGQEMELIKHISFVDCPGHESYMSAMINGTSVMDAAILVIAANQPVPQPQTYDHLLAISNTDVDNILILQNKLDLISEEACAINKQQIDEFIVGSNAEKSQIIPTSVQLKYNLDEILEYISYNIPSKIENLDVNQPGQMNIIRSFDINKPGGAIDTLKGGVVGGSISKGIFSIGDVVEIRPGVISQDCKTVTPIITRVVSLFSDKTPLEFAVPGGLIAMGLDMDASLTTSNRLVGHTIGHIGTLPKVSNTIKLRYNRFKRLDAAKPKKFKTGDNIIIILNSMSIASTILSTSSGSDTEGKVLEIQLQTPTCITPEDRLVIFQKIDTKWKLSACGTILNGTDGEPLVVVNTNPKYKEYLDSFTRPEYIFDADASADSEAEVKPYAGDYEALLTNIVFKGKKVKNKITPPEVKRVNRTSVFTNFGKCVESLDYSSSFDVPQYITIDRKRHLHKFFEDETGAVCNINAENHLIMKGRFFVKHVEKLLTNYIMKYMVCVHCKGMQTVLCKENRIKYVYCMKCRSANPISS